MGDPYYSLLKKVETALFQLNRDVQDRNSFLGPIAKKDASIRTQIKNSQVMIDELLAQVKRSEVENAYSLNRLELGQRRKMAFELQNNFKDIQAKFTNSNVKIKNNNNDWENNIERRDIDRMNSNQVIRTNQELRDEQDHIIDMISGAVSETLNGQKKMRDELLYQNKVLLPALEKGVDHNIKKIGKSNNALTRLLESKSNWSLYTIIAGLTAFLVFQIIIL